MASQKWKERAAELQARISSIRKGVKDSKTANAMMNVAAVGGGAVGCGRAKGYDYEEVGGMPVEYAGTAAGIAGYMATKRVEFLYAAAGFAAPYLAEMTEDQVRDYREGEDE